MKPLKHIWLDCLDELFKEASNKNKAEIIITALDIQHFYEIRHHTKMPNRIPSICNAMRFAMTSIDEEIKVTKSRNSSTYTIRYRLPRSETSVFENNKSLENASCTLNKSIHFDKPEKFFECLLKTFYDSKIINDCLEISDKHYRINNDGRIFYNSIISYPKNKFSSNYIKCVYRMLEKWNMNQRRAKLVNFEIFMKSLIDNAEKIKSLSGNSILNFDDKHIIGTLSNLFKELVLVETKSILVTFSKTLHFFLPDLIVPIDRKYTIDFFKIYGNKLINEDVQLSLFISLHEAFSKFAKQYNLISYVEKSSDWNLSIPKIIDNLIIGNKIVQSNISGGQNL